MRLTVLGSNGTHPTPGRPASGYLLEGDGLVWMDAGPGTLVALMERHDVGAVDGVVLSHGHGDHCLDLLPFLNSCRYGPTPRRGIPVLAPEGVSGRLAAFLGAGPDHAFYDVFDHRVIGPGDKAVLGGMSFSFGAAVHPVPAVVTRIEAGGAALAYSGDTGPGGDLVRVAVGADALLCEATSQGERRRGDYPYHLTAGEAGAAAAAAGAGRLLVTHVGPTLDPAVSVDEAAAEFDGPVEWAAPGLEVEL